MNRTLYVSDLDGTLLDPSSKVSAESAAILNPLIDDGLLFTVATARTPATVERLLEPLHPSGMPLILMTGAGYWSLDRHCFDYLRMMSANDSKLILREFRKEGIEPFVYCCSGRSSIEVFHTPAMTSREDAFYQERRNLPYKRIHLGEAANVKLPVILFFAIGTPEKMERICRVIKRRTDCSAAWYRDIFNPEVALMDVYAGGVSKAEAVKDVAKEMGCKRIVVFGDNLNDIPMMRAADLSVAVGNALPEVKAAADVVVGPNTAPSVAEFIAKDFESQC